MSVIGQVVSPGLSTVQDGGRAGYAAAGVPVSGAWHRQRYLLASSLLGVEGADRRAAVEVLGGTLSIAMGSAAVIALVGPARLAVSGRPAARGAALSVQPGDRVLVEWAGPGPSYLVLSGWSPTVTLGSVATDTFSRLGGRVLAPGDLLSGTPESGVSARVGGFHRGLDEPSGPLRVIATGMSPIGELLAVPWSVASAARSGVRLQGGAPAAAASAPSAPMLPGAVQVTPSGEAIVLGPDGGLTGGYPVPGVVATVDRDRISLLAPGESVTFVEIDVATAAGLRAEQVRRLATALAHPAALQ